MASRKLTLDELTDLLERFTFEPGGAKGSPEIAESHVQLLLARIAALTDALRGAEQDETARLATRMLLRDLAAVAAHYRGRANALRPLLAKAVAEAREALARTRATTESASSGGVAV